ncbi:hypothetical protein TWF788_006207 [Orbilia oligospora]|uniref:Glycosyl transferase CAP10 domain-containing protein n=2 Tax=Orbilia oligospora TaxID=2813651 RepID=A0A7C8QE67_ORBOL|nr:hypothetical protein TWF788_006207 [Orbilia oligospora]KAF3203498.1 hypothetical protein TWF679_010201 [Orbilia oligospora]KAF3209348.1 hypothetical protein TWF191_000408 [Orbilia oligospora]
MGRYTRMGGLSRRPFFLRIAFAEALLAAVGLMVVLKYFFNTDSSAVSDLFKSRSSDENRPRYPTLEINGRRVKSWAERSNFLTEKQCRKEYPLLFKPIDEAVGRGKFDFYRGPDDFTALVTARIKNNRLYVVSTSNTTNSHVNVMHRNAALHQVHKALATSPEPLPDTLFSFTPVDYPKNNSWVYSKWYDHTELLNHWPVPHFGHWSWPVKYVGPLIEVLSQVSEIESTLPFEEKVDKLFWRGTPSFNPIQNQNLRGNLIGATEGKDWADTGQLEWTALEKAKNIVQIPEICRYKYIAYTEGITYSGRLPFHMLCESVIITPPINYMMHSTHLIKPLFAWTLGFQSTKKMDNWGMKRLRKAWPKDYRPDEANAIFVSPDWSDLEETIMWLRENPKIAKGIATRQKEFAVEKGYLSESAEMCYWRELIRGWSKVAIPTGSGWNELGFPWETFALTGKTELR